MDCYNATVTGNALSGVRGPVVFGVIVAMSLVFVAGPSHADENEALTLYRKGEALFRAKRYRQAIRAFKRAFAKKPAVELILNLAQAYRKLGQLVEARDHYGRFLSLAPSHPLAQEAARLLTQVESELEQRRVAAEQQKL